MAESTALLDEIGSLDSWAGWLESLRDWAGATLTSQDTLIGLLIIGLGAALAKPLSAAVNRRLEEYLDRYSRNKFMTRALRTGIRTSFIAVWALINWIALLVTTEFGMGNGIIEITVSLLSAWVIIRLATIFVSSELWSKIISVFAWSIAALNILGLLDGTVETLDGITLPLGQSDFSLLTILQALITLAILLWVTTLITQIAESRLKSSTNLTPSMQVLFAKFMRIGLATIAFLLALGLVGVDFAAVAVFGGAIGVGLGFGLQKIFANLISGFILLMDKSIKPGDVIAVAEKYGMVDELTARYVSVITRDGIEHLIPNEELIVNRVENWSHSHSLIRLRKTVGVHYKSDVHKAKDLCLEAAAEVSRILQDPAPNCLMKEFGDSSVDLELRYWINDPMNGRANVTSELLFRIWDKFHKHNIEIPYPQRDLHLRSSEIGELANAADDEEIEAGMGESQKTES